MAQHRSPARKLTPDNSFLIDRETYAAMMGLVEKAESERNRVLERLEACQAQLRDLQADRGGQITEVGKLERSNRQLSGQNEELRGLCCHLDEQRHRSNHLATEWQSFGKYTAEVLRNEVETFESKLQALGGKLDRLGRENSELREMCLYLDQSRGEEVGNSETKLTTPPGSQDLPVHSVCAPEVNSTVGELPRYRGLTSHSTLKDAGRPRPHRLRDPTTTSWELEKRVERLEMEKLELVKSLSAAHLLAANVTSSHDMPASDRPALDKAERLEHPPKVETLLRSGSSTPPPEDAPAHEGDTGRHMCADKREPKSKTQVCPDPETIMQAITLLDVSKRLDAVEVSGFPDGVEEREVATLRMLISIAWKRLLQRSKFTSDQMSTSQL